VLLDKKKGKKNEKGKKSKKSNKGKGVSEHDGGDDSISD